MGISELISSDFLIFDGAMGTMLQEKGLKVGDLPETLNIENPEVVLDIHKAYVNAGSDIVLTNTFQANEEKLKNCPYSCEEIINAGVKIARASGAKFVAQDVGPIGRLMEPMGAMTFDDAYNMFKRQMIAGEKAGADVILIETMSDLYEVKAAVLAAKENTSLPVFCTMTFEQDQRTFTGSDPLSVVNVLNGLKVDAMGVNCSLGPNALIPVVDVFLKYSLAPVMIKPNAGLPKIVNGVADYDITPDEFVFYMKDFAKRGAAILGGCCGTNPGTIKKLSEGIKSTEFFKRNPMKITAASSATKTFVSDNNICVIGERINPTGKKKLKEAIRNRAFDYIISEAIAQTNAGADILDVNMGLPEIDESEMLVRAVKEIQAVSQLPLQIDSTDSKAIEQAIRYYNGKAIINSVNGKQKSMDEVFPIAKKYGALIIALTLDEKGIPEKAEDRFEIAKRIVDEAGKYGIGKEDIIVDTLVLTASAQQEQVLETIKAVTMVKNQLGVKTSLGVSNVSFGLPEREVLNSVFLAANFGAGLDMAILNPLSEIMMDVVTSFKVINAQDKDAGEYVDRFFKEQKDEPKTEINDKDLVQIIIQGRKDECAAVVKDMLNSMSPIEIIDNYFVKALKQVGDDYSKGRLFLPQLMQSAETVKKGFEIIKELPGDNAKEKSGKIILATVYGDIHDIGKNIVKLMLDNYGFDVIDLGKDVPISNVVEKAKITGAPLVGLSALMTTTVQSMKDTITALRNDGYEGKIMVGGAVLTEEYANYVGADFYAKDAADSVKIAEIVLKN